jgi:hypothetical protein
MSWLGGVAQGLGQAGEDIEKARREKVIETLNQSADTREQREAALRLRAGEQNIQQKNAPEVQYVKRGNDTYAISRDPNTGKVSASKVEGVPPEADPEELSVSAIEKQLGRKMSDEEKQRFFKIAPPNPKAAKFGSFIPAKDSPTGYKREILDGTTLKPTGEFDYGMPPGAIPTVRTGFKVMTDAAGNQFLVPVTTTTSKGNAPASAGGGSGKGGAPTKTESGSDLPKGAIAFGHKPLSATERRALGDIKQIQSRIDLTMALFDRAPDLKQDNSPIAPATNWLEYSKGHFAPSDPIRLKLIQDAAFLSLKGAAPFVTLGRGKFLLEQAQKHLPLPNDSPKLIYDKIVWLKEAAAEAGKYTADPFTEDKKAEDDGTPKGKVMQKYNIK